MSGLTQVTSDVISTNTISGLISQGFTSVNVATVGTQTIEFGSSNTLVFRANTSTERMRITTGGFVGINNTAPTRLVTVQSPTTSVTPAGGPTVLIYGDNNTERIVIESFTQPVYTGRGYSGTFASKGAVTQNQWLLDVQGGGYYDSANAHIGGRMGVFAAEAWTSTARGGYITFQTTSIGTTTLNEKVRIDANGNVGIATTAPAQRLHIGLTGSNNYIQFGTTNEGFVIGRENATGEFTFDATQASPYNVFRWRQSGTERMRITSAGDVAIGSTSADPFSTVNTRMVGISSSGGGTTTALNITSGAGSRIQFGIGTTRTAVIYSDSTNYTAISTETALPLVFVTNQTERMRIDSSGNVGIGTNSPSSYGSKLAILANQNSQLFAFLRNDSSGSSSASAIALNAYGNTWGMEIGSAAKNNNSLTWQLDYGGTNAERLRLTTDGTLILRGGSTSATGTGITFPASQAASSDANTLDDYEEGTWTPSYGGGITAATYGSARAGTYIKIGRSVTVHFVIMTDSVTRGSGGVTITGLPFTSSSATGSEASLSFSGAFRFDSNPPLWGRVGLNATTIALYSSINATGPGTDPVAVAPTDLNTGSGNRNIIVATVTYFTS